MKFLYSLEYEKNPFQYDPGIEGLTARMYSQICLTKAQCRAWGRAIERAVEKKVPPDNAGFLRLTRGHAAATERLLVLLEEVYGVVFR